MIRRPMYGLLPGLLVLTVSGCGDAKSRGGYGEADTNQPVASGAASTPLKGTESAGTTDSSMSGPAAQPADALRRYYDAIQNGRYDSAYALWGGSGTASGQTRAEFAKGFSQTEQTSVTIGDSVTVEGAAGSQYATVPVTVDAVLRSGAHQRFVGTYVLRRAMVDGATPEQRRWHIYSAHLQQR